MDKKTYQFKSLEQKYGSFIAPSFKINIGGHEIDSSKIPVSDLEVTIDAGQSAGGCTFTIRSQYNYATSKFENSLLDTIQVGQPVKVDAGYVASKEVFFGFVDNYTLSYDVQSSPSIHVSAIDAKAFLMSCRIQRYFNSKEPKSAINEMLDKCILAGYARKRTVGAINPFKAELIVTEQDYCTFLNTMAELYEMHFLVIDGEIIFDDLLSYTTPLIKLEWGANLMEFSKTLSVASQVDKVRVYSLGHTNDNPIFGEADSIGVYGEGESATETAYKFTETELVINNSFVKDSKECKRLAQSKLDSLAQSYVSCEGKCIGLPELIPGRYVEIDGLNQRTNGKYFIRQVKHTYDSRVGYFTSFVCSAPKSK